MLHAARGVHAGKARGFPDPPGPALAAFLDNHLTRFAAQRGWDKGIVPLRPRDPAGHQDTPGAPIQASDTVLVSQLHTYKVTEPTTALLTNPHLFLNHRTAGHLKPVHADWISRTLGLSAQAVLEDRILHEVIATDGDIRRICDLFGLGVSAAERYTAVRGRPELDQRHRS